MKLYIFLIWLLSCSFVYTQNKQLLYGLKEVPQSLLINPSTQMAQKAHFSIPFLSQFHFSGGASGVSVYDIFGTDGRNINDKIEDKIFQLTPNDFFYANQQWELFNFGWRNKKDVYFSGGVYQEFDFIFYYPRDLAILAWEGNASNLDYPFQLNQLSSNIDLLTTYHFGFQKQINNNLQIGGRAKIYSSILNVKSINNEGTFATSLASQDANNIYNHTINNALVTVNTSGVANLQDNFSASGIISRGLLAGNLGLGVDIGATYNFNNHWEASASILDIGTIFHTNQVETYQAKGSYNLEGIELLFPPLNEGEPTFPYYQDLEDQLEAQLPIDTLNNAYTKWRPTQFNVSLAYNFGEILEGNGECDCLNRGKNKDRNQALGLQYFSVMRPKGLQMAGTFYYYRRLWNVLATKLTYTVDAFTNSNVGLGIVGDIGKFNFYFALDNLLNAANYAKANHVSLQLGFNIKIDE